MARDSVLTRVATGAAVGGAIGGAVGEISLFIHSLIDSFFTKPNTEQISLFSLVNVVNFSIALLYAGAVYGTYDAIRYKVCDSTFYLFI